MAEKRQYSSGATSRPDESVGNREPDSEPLPPRAAEGQEALTFSGAPSSVGSGPVQQPVRGPAWVNLPVCRIEPIALMIVDVLATYLALYCAAWGTTKWATATGATGGLLAIGVLAVVNVGVFAAFKMYNSLWRYASMTERCGFFTRPLSARCAGICCSLWPSTAGCQCAPTSWPGHCSPS